MSEGMRDGGYPDSFRECGYPSEPPTIRTNGYADILAKRDMLLRELEALRNKAAGLNFAIGVVAEELAAQAIETAKPPRRETGSARKGKSRISAKI